MNRIRHFIVALLFALAAMQSSLAFADTKTSTAPTTATQDAATVAAEAVSAAQSAQSDAARLKALHKDPVAATQVYMDRLKGEAREKSDGYFEGGNWLLLWNLLYGLAVAWLFLAKGISVRLRNFVERKVSGKNIQALLYGFGYTAFFTAVTLPIVFYETYWREHQYGMSNHTLTGWVGEFLTNFAVELVLSGIAVVVLYVILRRLPKTWWAWAGLASSAFVVGIMMLNPVFIAPLFNTYKPLPEGELRSDILSMARANGIPADNVYFSDASKQTKRISANVSGIFGTTRITLNDNLLNRTSPAEIRAVMAHEMGHYVLNHSVKHCIGFSLILLGGLLFVRASWQWAHARFGARFGIRGLDDIAGLPLFVALFSVFFFLATPVYKTMIRTAEIEADMFGLNASREPDGFAEAIYKLSEYRKMQPGPMEEAIFFTHPSGYNRIYAAMRWKAEQPHK